MLHFLKKLFIKNYTGNSITEDRRSESDEWFTPKSANELLDSPTRKRLISLIWQRVSLDQKRFDDLYMSVIKNYVEIVQLLPASESHHHSYIGGMIDHGLEVANYALKLRQSHLLGSYAEDIPRQAQAWSASVVYGALLHDIGKVVVDINVEMNNGDTWYPWQQNLNLPYRFSYRTDRDYSLHPCAAALMIKRILPDECITWLSQFPELFKLFISLCSGHTEKAGVLAEIIQKADMFSVSNNLGGDPTKILSKPVSLVSKIIISIRYLIESELKLNGLRACDGWFDGNDVWVISKSFTDRIRANLLQNGITELPNDNAKIFNILREHGLAVANGEKTIWSCKIESESGWVAEKLTLIRIPVNVAFNNISNAPEPFKGSIIPVDLNSKQDEVESMTEAEKSEAKFIVNDDKDSAMQNTIFNLFSNDDISVGNNNGKCANAGNESLEANNTANSEIQVINNISNEISETKTVANEDIQKYDTLKETNNMTNNEIQGFDNTSNEISETKNIVNDDIQEYYTSKETNDTIHDNPFFKWIRRQIINKNLPVNNQNACIHTVDDKIFMVTPKIFKKYSLYINGNSDDSNWKLYQREFQSFKIHIKFSDEGFNIWKCLISGKRKSNACIKGYLIDNKTLFAIENNFPNNPHLTLIHDINIYKNT